jgi:small subunit ribosomal protein S17
METKKMKENKKQEKSSTSFPKKAEATILPRGKIFKGIVVRKFPKRIAIEFERTVFLSKFETFMKKKTRIHARLPESLSNVEIGDMVLVQECRPLSKIIHFIVTEKVTGENN